MDPTKTNSYRRWRNKLIPKGFSRTFLSTDDSFKKTRPSSEVNEKAEKSRVFRQMGEENEIQGLLKTLEREYRKSESFRQDRVLEIKKLIKQGLYRVPGKMVVEKWFP
jgi:anti-sigma28 factor (negative regulator of flagellin synthesis)